MCKASVLFRSPNIRIAAITCLRDTAKHAASLLTSRNSPLIGDQKKLVFRIDDVQGTSTGQR